MSKKLREQFAEETNLTSFDMYGSSIMYVEWLEAKLKEAEEGNKKLLIDFAEWRDIQGFSIVREDEIKWYLDRNKNF